MQRFIIKLNVNKILAGRKMTKTKHTVHVSEIMIPLQLKRLETGEYLATSRALPGLLSQGRTMAEAMEIAQDVAKKLIESYLEHGDPLPGRLRKQYQHKTKTVEAQIPIAVNF